MNEKNNRKITVEERYDTQISFSRITMCKTQQ